MYIEYKDMDLGQREQRCHSLEVVFMVLWMSC